MKTLQQLLQATPIEAVYNATSSLKLTDAARSFYHEMTTMEGISPDTDHILFAAAYVSWDKCKKTPDFSATVYDVRSARPTQIMFIPRKELLGYLVSDMSIAQYGKATVLGAILEEVVFFGYEEQAAVDEQESLLSAAKEFETETASPVEALLAEMGINPEDLVQTQEEMLYTSRVMEQNVAIRDTQIAGILAQLAQ